MLLLWQVTAVMALRKPDSQLAVIRQQHTEDQAGITICPICAMSIAGILAVQNLHQL